MCLRIWTLKIINFPFVKNGKLIIFSVPKFRHITNYGVLKILEHLKFINFPFGTNGKLMVLGVPVLKHYRVRLGCSRSWSLFITIHDLVDNRFWSLM